MNIVDVCRSPVKACATFKFRNYTVSMSTIFTNCTVMILDKDDEPVHEAITVNQAIEWILQNPVTTQMQPNQCNRWDLFPGSNAQWTDSCKRFAVYRRYTLGKHSPVNLALAFIEYPPHKQAQAAAEYALSINLPTTR